MTDDFRAGQTLTDNHFPPTTDDREDGSFSFTITAFGVATTAGTYVECGQAFTAGKSGRALVLWGGNHLNSGAGSTLLCPVVRAGSTVGAGATVEAATNAIASGMQGTSAVVAGRCHLVEGLTDGDTYNVRLEHRASSGTGTISQRNVVVLLVP